MLFLLIISIYGAIRIESSTKDTSSKSADIKTDSKIIHEMEFPITGKIMHATSHYTIHGRMFI